MSAGAFDRAFYEDDTGAIRPIRPQPETLAATFDGVTNAGATGPATNNGFVQINKPRREFGTGGRFVTAEWAAAPPTGYKIGGSIKIVVPLTAVYNGITIFSAGVYLGANIRIIGKTPEQNR